MKCSRRPRPATEGPFRNNMLIEDNDPSAVAALTRTFGPLSPLYLSSKLDKYHKGVLVGYIPTGMRPPRSLP